MIFMCKSIEEINIITLVDIKTKWFSWKWSIIKSSDKWCWKTYFEKDRNTRNCITEINPIPRIKTWFKWQADSFKMMIFDEAYKQCEGCGEGIATWKARDPNHGSGNKWWNYCDKCISFYGLRYPWYKIVKWKDGKSIGRKSK